MWSGVSKSGSPRLRSITSIPFDRSSLQSFAIFKVSGSLKRTSLDDNSITRSVYYGNFLVNNKIKDRKSSYLPLRHKGRKEHEDCLCVTYCLCLLVPYRIMI